MYVHIDGYRKFENYAETARRDIRPHNFQPTSSHYPVPAIKVVLGLVTKHNPMAIVDAEWWGIIKSIDKCYHALELGKACQCGRWQWHETWIQSHNNALLPHNRPSVPPSGSYVTEIITRSICHHLLLSRIPQRLALQVQTLSITCWQPQKPWVCGVLTTHLPATSGHTDGLVGAYLLVV